MRRRGGLVHGEPVHEATKDEAERAIAFADQMAKWYAGRFLTGDRHPINWHFREVLEQARRSLPNNDQ